MWVCPCFHAEHATAKGSEGDAWPPEHLFLTRDTQKPSHQKTQVSAIALHVAHATDQAEFTEIKTFKQELG